MISDKVTSNEVTSGYFITSSLITITNTLQRSKARLTKISSTPSLDAQVLLAHITGQSRAWLLAHPEVPLSSQEFQQFEKALQKLESGLPLPYLLGEWEFFGLKFKVTPEVLIPRPETELLVETALEWINKQVLPQKRKEERKARKEDSLKNPLRPSRNLRVLRGEDSKNIIWAADVGTGSGCIAVALAVHCPNLHVLATDLSPAALEIAQHNAQTHHVADRITFAKADLLTFNLQTSSFILHPSSLHLITANLPYIPTPTLRTLAVYGREPTLALDGGPDGLALIRRFLPQAATHLAPGGLMLLEIEATQGEAVAALARQHFPDALIHVKPDLTGNDRLLTIQSPW